MKCRLSLKHPVRLEEAEYSAKLMALAETGREGCSGQLCEGQVMEAERNAFKERKREK